MYNIRVIVHIIRNSTYNVQYSGIMYIMYYMLYLGVLCSLVGFPQVLSTSTRHRLALIQTSLYVCSGGDTTDHIYYPKNMYWSLLTMTWIWDYHLTFWPVTFCTCRPVFRPPNNKLRHNMCYNKQLSFYSKIS